MNYEKAVQDAQILNAGLTGFLGVRSQYIVLAVPQCTQSPFWEFITLLVPIEKIDLAYSPSNKTPSKQPFIGAYIRIAFNQFLEYAKTLPPVEPEGAEAAYAGAMLWYGNKIDEQIQLVP
jgi:hypothetical protein